MATHRERELRAAAQTIAAAVGAAGGDPQPAGRPLAVDAPAVADRPAPTVASRPARAVVFDVDAAVAARRAA